MTIPTDFTVDPAPLLARLDYSFKNNDLLLQALTHPSISQRSQSRKAGASAYERLEFLGDRVLGLIIAGWLYEAYPTETEGVLARHLAALVRRDTLAQVADELELLTYVQRAAGPKGNDAEDTRGRATLLGDAFEALLGAIYLDSQDLAFLTHLIRQLFATIFAGQASAAPDPKTALQEWAQGRGLPLPVYTITDRSGPSHAPQFTVEVRVENLPPASATGASKQEAEKAAAAALLAQLN